MYSYLLSMAGLLSESDQAMRCDAMLMSTSIDEFVMLYTAEMPCSG